MNGTNGASSTVLLAGTRKGLFILKSRNRAEWAITGPFQPGREINHAILDERTGRIVAAANDPWFGSEVVCSDDQGANWVSAKTGPAFAEASGLKMERLWTLAVGRPEESGVLYCGVAPAALFRSEDGGSTWGEVSALTSHETRPKWSGGGGGLCLHSITRDVADASRLYVGISAVGVFRTDDAGRSWATANRGTRAEFLPDKLPEWGQCVHKLIASPTKADLVYQQNHCGVYRSENAGTNWTEITAGLPSDFGFPLALHPRDEKRLYVIPLKGGEFRCPPEGKLAVWSSRDGGATWQAQRKGLPQENAYMGVYREAMASDRNDPAGIYFGTNTGKLFGSADEGESWRVIADNLPPIFSVSAGHVY